MGQFVVRTPLGYYTGSRRAIAEFTPSKEAAKTLSEPASKSDATRLRRRGFVDVRSCRSTARIDLPTPEPNARSYPLQP